jgi:hypothetical protein
MMRSSSASALSAMYESHTLCCPPHAGPPKYQNRMCPLSYGRIPGLLSGFESSVKDINIVPLSTMLRVVIGQIGEKEQACVSSGQLLGFRRISKPLL